MIEEFLKHCEKLSLKKEALRHVQSILRKNKSTELDIENYYHLIPNFKAYTLIVNESQKPIIRTSFELLHEDLNIGYFDVDTDWKIS
jgi:hypothetical protein